MNEIILFNKINYFLKGSLYDPIVGSPTHYILSMHTNRYISKQFYNTLYDLYYIFDLFIIWFDTVIWFDYEF